jgi:hypothetical protein
MDGRVYLVDDTVEIVNTWQPTPIIALCDTDGEGTSKPAKFILENEEIQFISVCSPNGVDEKWTYKLPGTMHVMKYVAALWSAQELFMTGCVTALRV